jgi:putative hemolysin
VSNWKFYLFLTIGCILIQGFYAMLEMACVSFNKVRLQYYVSKGSKRAKWLSYLLNNPALLFGTTLIGVNAALQLGSECSRRFYDSVGLNPDLAPLTEIVLVLIFAEIAPIFAGRRFAEHAAMLGLPFLYATSIILRPVIWLLDFLCRGVNKVFGKQVAAEQFLTREELQTMLEEREENPQASGKKTFNTIVSNIFSLKTKTAKELMQPLNKVHLIPAICTIAEMRSLLQSSYTPYLPIYHRTRQNIIAIAYPRDLLRLQENKKVRDHARPPWFILESNSILQILKQFRRNNETVAVVLDGSGLAVGILTLDEVIDELFGQSDAWFSFEDVSPPVTQVLLDRTFPGDMKIADFNQQFNVHLAFEDAKTLDELVLKVLGHIPTVGETVRIDQFELTVEEASLLRPKSISIRTL